MRAPLLLICMLLCASYAKAQTGLSIEPLFGDMYKESPGIRMTKIEGGELKKMKLAKFYSFTLETPDEKLSGDIEHRVKHDGAQALEKETQYRERRLYYGLYQLRDAGPGRNRYIVYMNRGGNDGKVIVIYLEGKATFNDIKKLIEKN